MGAGADGFFCNSVTGKSNERHSESWAVAWHSNGYQRITNTMVQLFWFHSSVLMRSPMKRPDKRMQKRGTSHV